jgi:hypothetical protein
MPLSRLGCHWEEDLGDDAAIHALGLRTRRLVPPKNRWFHMVYGLVPPKNSWFHMEGRACESAG